MQEKKPKKPLKNQKTLKTGVRLTLSNESNSEKKYGISEMILSQLKKIMLSDLVTPQQHVFFMSEKF